MKKFLGLAICAFTAATALAVRPTTIYLVQHTHTDIGYTRPQAEILGEHLRYIDFALEYCALTDDYPDEAKFRWTCEAACDEKGLVVQVRMLEAGSFAIRGPNGKPLTLRRIDATERPLGPAVRSLSARAGANLIVRAE